MFLFLAYPGNLIGIVLQKKMKRIKTEYLIYVVNFFVIWLIRSNGKLICMLKKLVCSAKAYAEICKR